MKHYFQRIAVFILVALPIVSLVLNAVSWLRYGYDLPFFDDWWGYVRGQKGALDAANLFKPLNDTLAPVGYFLDALAQRYLDGNSIAYQFLSMVIVLGGLLLLQWKLLKQALGDSRLAAICFVFTLLMLQPGSYWGRENLAYHQALPLLFILGSLALMLSPTARDIWRLPVVLLLGLLAGFSYISGAFAALATGLVLTFVAGISKPSTQRTNFLRGGIALSIAGAISSGFQFLLAVFPNVGFTHRPDAPIALPYESDFWFFLLGKVGRSLLLPGNFRVSSLVVVLVICAVAIACGLVFLKRIGSKSTTSEEEYRVGMLYLAVAATVSIYLALIAAGRTNLRPPEVESAIAVFSYGFYRFHFFWATLLWPWLVAAGLVLFRERAGASPRISAVVCTLVLVSVIVFVVNEGAFRHARNHREESLSRRATVACLIDQVQRGDGIFCREFNRPDITPAYMYARASNASFIRYFPVLPIPMGTNEPAAWFRLTRDAKRIEMQNIVVKPKSGGRLSARANPRLLVEVGKPVEMSECRLLDVYVMLGAERADAVQIGFRPKGMAEFQDAYTKRVPVEASLGAPKQLSFQFESSTGFEDQLRITPASAAQELEIPEIEVRCRMRFKSPPA